MKNRNSGFYRKNVVYVKEYSENTDTRTSKNTVLSLLLTLNL